MHAAEEPRARLARAVEATISDEGWEYSQVAQRAGFSIETLAKIRRGQRVRTRTLRRLEEGLRWPRGRTEELLGLPAPNPASAAPLTAPARGEFDEDLERLGLNPDDPDVLAIIGEKRLRASERRVYLEKLAAAVAESRRKEAHVRRVESIIDRRRRTS